MISYHDAVMPEIEAGNFTWADISPDNVHPNDDGHVIMASLLTKFVGNIKDNIDSVDKEAKAFDTSTVAPTGDVFADATIGSRQTEDIVKTTDEEHSQMLQHSRSSQTVGERQQAALSSLR